MKKSDRPVEAIEYKLSGVVTVPPQQPNSDALHPWIISSFRETRFQNVLKRALVLPQTSWFWHHKNKTQLCDSAIAIISATTNDYIQVLTKRYRLAPAVQELDPFAELLLLISPLEDFVFGTVLETGEMFSTHILFTEQRASRHRSNLSPVCTTQITLLPKRARVHITTGGKS